MYLINEASIVQETPSDMSALEYYHIEFDTHEVIYAEGALVESYDGSNRENFSKFRPIRATLWGRASIQDGTVRTDSPILGPAPGVEGPCKIFNF